MPREKKVDEKERGSGKKNEKQEKQNKTKNPMRNIQSEAQNMRNKRKEITRYKCMTEQIKK